TRIWGNATSRPATFASQTGARSNGRPALGSADAAAVRGCPLSSTCSSHSPKFRWSRWGNSDGVWMDGKGNLRVELHSSYFTDGPLAGLSRQVVRVSRRSAQTSAGPALSRQPAVHLPSGTPVGPVALVRAARQPVHLKTLRPGSPMTSRSPGCELLPGAGTSLAHQFLSSSGIGRPCLGHAQRPSCSVGSLDWRALVFRWPDQSSGRCIGSACSGLLRHWSPTGAGSGASPGAQTGPKLLGVLAGRASVGRAALRTPPARPHLQAGAARSWRRGRRRPRQTRRSASSRLGRSSCTATRLSRRSSGAPRSALRSPAAEGFAGCARNRRRRSWRRLLAAALTQELQVDQADQTGVGHRLAYLRLADTLGDARVYMHEELELHHMEHWSSAGIACPSVYKKVAIPIFAAVSPRTAGRCSGRVSIRSDLPQPAGRRPSCSSWRVRWLRPLAAGRLSKPPTRPTTRVETLAVHVRQAGRLAVQADWLEAAEWNFLGQFDGQRLNLYLLHGCEAAQEGGRADSGETNVLRLAEDLLKELDRPVPHLRLVN
uniref:Alpha-galactosidase n=1 Tax=Macrostomum lignano TaxID=282301 RepID=A0A1I8JRM0_9PLAT